MQQARRYAGVNEAQAEVYQQKAEAVDMSYCDTLKNDQQTL